MARGIGQRVLGMARKPYGRYAGPHATGIVQPSEATCRSIGCNVSDSTNGRRFCSHSGKRSQLSGRFSGSRHKVLPGENCYTDAHTPNTLVSPRSRGRNNYYTCRWLDSIFGAYERTVASNKTSFERRCGTVQVRNSQKLHYRGKFAGGTVMSVLRD